ncbi:helix-turn-helix domain-containing protein [Confluentibacter lentus]|uniref:helix-turn-helix domain-containing protein n=1 Tax=Confluentibacter lentus TaxID=1699412 RepID=UPI000C292DE1|nr:AraC family transcriptional regulator [Confluentibacter lentus]
MEKNQIIRIKSITEGHRLANLPKPKHPLISIIESGTIQGKSDISITMDFYMISLKTDCNNLQYGQQSYDFDEGMMAFIAPNQVLTGRNHSKDHTPKGWIMFIHPDFLWNTPLAKKIKQYEFFGYATNEALFVSDKEKSIIYDIVKNIENEYNSNIDKFSQDIIISHLETLLNYSERFYQRQFITRKITNNKLLNRLEDILSDYFNDDDLLSKGLPTVQYIADNLNISAKYLGSMLKQFTGLSTQQHIHEKLIDKAKEKLSITELSVSEIAYSLGFEHPQSFSKLFKAKTNQSPLEFRQAFN